MAARLIPKGQVIRVIDLEGQQCFDCIIWDANDLSNASNCLYSIIFNGKWDKWQPGDVIYSQRCDQLAMITADTTDGTHAFIGGFCSEPYWRAILGLPGCPNCLDNLVAAMANYSFSAQDIDWGSCISFFMPFYFNPDGTIGREMAKNKPGDYIDLTAQRDIIVAISNCPNEWGLVNAYNPTALLAVVFEPGEEYRAQGAEFKP